jgi:hypothetical protein
VFRSVDDLTTALEEWIKLWNQDARPFTWAKTAGQMIDRIGRYCARISEPAHEVIGIGEVLLVRGTITRRAGGRAGRVGESLTCWFSLTAAVRPWWSSTASVCVLSGRVRRLRRVRCLVMAASG